MGDANVEMFDPFHLDIEKIYARLSFQGSAQTLPTNWRSWKQPSPALPIDRFISELRERRAAPKMRSPDELARIHRFGLCPYALARAEVARATLNALMCVDTEQHRGSATTLIGQAAKELPGLRTQIQAMVNRLMLITEAQEYAFDPELNCDPLVQHADNLAAAWSALGELGGPLTRLHVRHSQMNVNANVWKISFVGLLFSAWWQLTGRDPSTTEPFTTFLDAAWQTIADGDFVDDMQWESAIKTARARSRQKHGSDTPWRSADCQLDPSMAV